MGGILPYPWCQWNSAAHLISMVGMCFNNLLSGRNRATSMVFVRAIGAPTFSVEGIVPALSVRGMNGSPTAK